MSRISFIKGCQHVLEALLRVCVQSVGTIQNLGTKVLKIQNVLVQHLKKTCLPVSPISSSVFLPRVLTLPVTIKLKTLQKSASSRKYNDRHYLTRATATGYHLGCTILDKWHHIDIVCVYAKKLGKRRENYVKNVHVIWYSVKIILWFQIICSIADMKNCVKHPCFEFWCLLKAIQWYSEKPYVYQHSRSTCLHQVKSGIEVECLQ